MKTFTQTKTVTNTQLAIAAAVLLGVSALAFLVIPAFTNSSTAPYYRYASWECQDGYGQGQGSPTTCVNYTTWFDHAQSFCAGRCNYRNNCGLQSFTVSTPCSFTAPCLGVYQKVYGNLKCCAGLKNVNGVCGVTSACTAIGQEPYLYGVCCAGLTFINGRCENPKCIDRDLKDIYNAGNITNSTGKILATDKCANRNWYGGYTIVTRGKYVAERICTKSGMETKYYACTKGCINGACIK
jgi:hypothetical protein